MNTTEALDMIQTALEDNECSCTIDSNDDGSGYFITIETWLDYNNKDVVFECDFKDEKDLAGQLYDYVNDYDVSEQVKEYAPLMGERGVPSDIYSLLRAEEAAEAWYASVSDTVNGIVYPGDYDRLFAGIMGDDYHANHVMFS